jgi:hypothetical protein
MTSLHFEVLHIFKCIRSYWDQNIIVHQAMVRVPSQEKEDEIDPIMMEDGDKEDLDDFYGALDISFS